MDMSPEEERIFMLFICAAFLDVGIWLTRKGVMNPTQPKWVFGCGNNVDYTCCVVGCWFAFNECIKVKMVDS